MNKILAWGANQQSLLFFFFLSFFLFPPFCFFGRVCVLTPCIVAVVDLCVVVDQLPARPAGFLFLALGKQNRKVRCCYHSQR